MPIGEIVSGLKGLNIMLWILDDKVHVNEDTSKGLLLDVLGKVEGLMTLGLQGMHVQLWVYNLI